MGTLAVPLLAMMIDMFKASCCPRVGQEKAFCVTIAIMVIMCSVIMCVCVWTCAFDAVFVFEENNAYYLASYKITRCF